MSEPCGMGLCVSVADGAGLTGSQRSPNVLLRIVTPERQS
jgi:hypothetical protein